MQPNCSVPHSLDSRMFILLVQTFPNWLRVVMLPVRGLGGCGAIVTYMSAVSIKAALKANL